MKLEEAIKQKEFKSEYQKLYINIIFTSNWIQGKHKRSFDQFGITPQQFNVLRILKGNYPKPYTTSQIRERMLDPMSDASRIVDRLMQKGLVDRKTCKSDRRLVDVVINQKGLDLIEQCSKEIMLQENLLLQLTESEARSINELLDKLRG